MLTHSFETLAQSFRVLIESHWDFHRLISIDRAEAIGNLESGINNQLNAFHSFYDQMNALELEPDWYLIPELLTVLVIRNARHHNKANRIRTLPNFHRYMVTPPENEKTYFYVDTPETEDGGDFFDVPVSWSDIDEMLLLPRNESRLRPEARDRVRTYLNADKFEREAQEKGYSKEDIFINFVAFTHNAGVALYPYISDKVTPDGDSTEAQYFFKHFETVEKGNTAEPVYSLLTFRMTD